MATSVRKKPTTASKAPPPETDVEIDGEDGAAAPPKKRSVAKLLLLVALALLLVGGGASWYFLGEQSAEEPQKASKPKQAAVKEASPKPAIFIPLEPFTVNLQPDGLGAQYLQVGLSLRAKDDKLSDAVKQNLPEIRNRILLLLSNKRAGEISTLEGKKDLSDALAKAVKESLAGQPVAAALESVLFTSFVIQ